jgi:hypothetical protein
MVVCCLQSCFGRPAMLARTPGTRQPMTSVANKRRQTMAVFILLSTFAFGVVGALRFFVRSLDATPSPQPRVKTKGEWVAEVWLEWPICRGSTMYRQRFRFRWMARLAVRFHALLLDAHLPTHYRIRTGAGVLACTGTTTASATGCESWPHRNVSAFTRSGPSTFPAPGTTAASTHGLTRCKVRDFAVPPQVFGSNCFQASVRFRRQGLCL